jgi:hypothetical protein
MRSADVTDISQRRMDHLSAVSKVASVTSLGGFARPTLNCLREDDLRVAVMVAGDRLEGPRLASSGCSSACWRFTPGTKNRRQSRRGLRHRLLASLSALGGQAEIPRWPDQHTFSALLPCNTAQKSAQYHSCTDRCHFPMAV